MKILQISDPSKNDATFGTIFVDDVQFCYSLEDVVREVPGQPVESWKIPGKTAIPAGIYDVMLVDSPKFGPDTITLIEVPGFKHVRVHSVRTAADTEGCIGVGDMKHDEIPPRISGGWMRRVKERLQKTVKAAMERGEPVTWEVRRTA